MCKMQVKDLERLRYAHFMAQCHHESGGFKYTHENLNYSVNGLLTIFSKYYDTPRAKQEAYSPRLIANRVYGGRMGNKNADDGYKFRGRGYIMCTGYNNYYAFSQWVGDDCVSDPNKVEELYPYQVALWYFDVNKLWNICDEGISDKAIKNLTRRINGGYNGLEERIRLTKYYYNNYGKI